jgi:hypothetical protein
LALFALLPLQWFVVAQTPLGVGRVHQLAMLAVAGVVLTLYRTWVTSSVLVAARPFVLANLAFLSIWFAASVYHGWVPTGPVEQGLYLLVMLAVGTCVHLAASHREPGSLAVLRWAGPVAVFSLLVGLSVSMLANSVNPVQVLAQTIATGDPELFQKELFRNSFAGFGYDAETVQGNIRHEVFAAALLAMYVSSWACSLHPLRSRGQRAVYVTGMVIGGVLLLMSLSRSVQLAALAWPLLAALRAIVVRSVTVRQARAIGVATVFVVALAASGFVTVLWNRVTADTTSYDARGRLLDAALEGISRNWLLGGVDPEGNSSHNLVLDAWLRSGVLAGIAAMAVGVILVGYALALLLRIGREPGWMVPVLAAMALPLVRLVTSGAGVIPPVEWVALGFIFGVLAYRREQRRPQLPLTAGADRSVGQRHG